MAKKETDNRFYFESDHVALKGNSDYQAVLRAVALLEAQRSKALSDLDVLLDARDVALSDPLDFMNKLQHNQVTLPAPQAVADVPDIKWENYTVNLDSLSAGMHKHSTRHNLKKEQKSNDSDSPDEVTQTMGGTSKARRQQHQIFQPKTETFNKLWTVEEQRHLEELLQKYPPEEIEARRWEKIANELTNRDPKQVQSRVQKYFIKLAKARLPIPGRMPNLKAYANRTKYGFNTRINKCYLYPSTFLQAYEQPVFMNMNDDDDHMGQPVNMNSGYSTMSSGDEDDDTPDEMKGSVDYQELMNLQRELVRRRTARDVIDASQADDGGSSSSMCTYGQTVSPSKCSPYTS